jgi:hypothetical protein
MVPAFAEPDNRADCEGVGEERVLNHFVHQDASMQPQTKRATSVDW